MDKVRSILRALDVRQDMEPMLVWHRGIPHSRVFRPFGCCGQTFGGLLVTAVVFTVPYSSLRHIPFILDGVLKRDLWTKRNQTTLR